MNLMISYILLFLSLAAGFALGGLFFGGLWYTTKRITVSKRPALLFLGSFVLRSAIVLTGFYFVAAGDIKRMLLCLSGFVLARFVVNRSLPLLKTKTTFIEKEVHHET